MINEEFVNEEVGNRSWDISESLGGKTPVHSNQPATPYDVTCSLYWSFIVLPLVFCSLSQKLKVTMFEYQKLFQFEDCKFQVHELLNTFTTWDYKTMLLKKQQ